ncbi:MAG TPA: hypothetical protein VG847_07160 [Chitinophagaceae bacterium]|nr:hypothetical protein [Chitinophagaceae bacterium]
MGVRELIIFTLAVWRITHLLSKEDGPFNIIFKFRQAVGAGFLGSLLDCFYCTSVWVSFPFGLWMGGRWQEKLICWIALSGAACLAERITDKGGNDHESSIYFEDKEN